MTLPRVRHAFAAITALLSATLGFAQQAADLGPAPTTGFGGATGRVSALACSPTNANLYYAAGADGGVWRSDNAGVSWRPLTDQQPTLAMGALALHPTNDQIIYAGTGEANFANHSRPGVGILRSTDGGGTWSLHGQNEFAGRCISRIIVDPVTPATLYAASTRAGGFPALAAAKGHPMATAAVGVFKSVDGGQTWAQLSGGLPPLDATDLAIDRVNPQNVYAAIGHIFGSPLNGVWKSTNGGTTWNKLTNGLPAMPVGRIGLACSASDPLRLYMNFVNSADATGNNSTFGGAARSVDGGASWTPITPGVDTSTYGWYFGCVGVHPANPLTVFMGGINARLSDNGTSFFAMTGAHPDFHAVAWDAQGRMVVGCDGGVYRATGNTFAPLNPGLSICQFYAGISTDPSNPLVIMGGLQDNGTVRRSTNTQTWAMPLGSDGGWTQIDQTNPQRVFGESQGTGVLSRSDNGGGSWVAAGTGLSGRNCFLPPYLIDYEIPGRMVYGTERVWVSTNYGNSWSMLSGDLTNGGGAIRTMAMRSVYVYAVTNDGNVLGSANRGANFTILRRNHPGWPRVTREVTIDPTSIGNGFFLAGSGYGVDQVLLGTIAGTFDVLDGDLPDIPVNAIGVDTRPATVPILYAGTDAGLYRSINFGMNWRLVEALPRACVVDMIVEPQRQRIIVATQGRGAWELPIPPACTPDFNGDGDFGTDQDIEAFFACLAGNCCQTCGTADFNLDGDFGTDQDIEAFFRVLAGGHC